MEIKYNGMQTYTNPHQVNVDTDLTIGLDFGDSAGPRIDPSTLTWAQVIQRPSIWLAVNSMGGNLTFPSTLMFKEGCPPALPAQGLTMIRVVSLGADLMLACEIILDIK